MNLKKAVVNAYQTNTRGDLALHLEDDARECAELVIPAADVQRLMHAAIDALSKKAGTR